MPGPANALNINEEGLVYFNGTNDFSGIPGVTAGFVLTDNGAGMPGSYQAIQTPPLPITPVDFAGSPYTVLPADRYLEVDASGGAISIVLEAARATGVPLIIKDAGGQASTNNITLSIASGPAVIDGSATFVMSTDYEAIGVIFDGTNYEIYAAYNTGGGSSAYYSITPYIVGPDSNSQYSTIQAAITQAVADGVSASNPKNIYIKPKNSAYAETLTGADGIRLIGLSVGASSSTNDLPNCSVIWNGELTWPSGTMTIQNIRCAYSGSGTSIEFATGNQLKMMNCQIQNSGGQVFGSSNSGASIELDTCFVNSGVLYDSDTYGINLRAQKSYIYGDINCVSYSILADYCTFGSQVTNGTGGSALVNAVMNFCFITGGTVFNNQNGTSTGNSIRLNNCYLQNAAPLIAWNKGTVILQGCSGQCNSLFDDSYGTGSNSISLYACNILENTTDVLQDGSQMNLYGCVGINAPSLGSGSVVNYYNTIADTNATNNSNTIINSADVGTSATYGFLHLPSCNGTPSGTPILYGDAIPCIVDRSSNKTYIYSSGAWREVGGGGGGAIGGTNYIYVAGNGTADANFVDLVAAYATAVADTPSSTNIWTIVCGPGYYNDASNTGLQMNTSYVNLVSLTGNKDVIISNGAFGGVPSIELTADNVFIRGILADPNCPIYTGATLANIRIENCESMYYNSFAGDSTEQGSGTFGAAGTFVDCVAGDGSFGGTGNGASTCSASGTFIRCKGGSYCFAGNGGGSPGTATASGTFIDCEAQTTAFGSEGASGGSCSGTFIRCKLTGLFGTASGFGTGFCVVTSTAVFQDCTSVGGGFGVGGVSCDGTFINCKGVDNCFGYSSGTGNTCAGTFINCVAQDYSFGANATASGTFENCVGRDWCFGSVPNGSSDGDPSGTFTNCIGRDYCFGGVGGGGSTGTCTGTFTNCSGRNSCFGFFGAAAAGNFYNCVAPGNGGGSFGDADFSGFAMNCIGGSGSFGPTNLTGVLNFCKTLGTFNTVSGGGRTVYCIDGSNNTNNQ